MYGVQGNPSSSKAGDNKAQHPPGAEEALRTVMTLERLEPSAGSTSPICPPDLYSLF